MSSLVHHRCRHGINPSLPTFVAPLTINIFQRKYRCRASSQEYWHQFWGAKRLAHGQIFTCDKTGMISRKTHIQAHCNAFQEQQTVATSSDIPRSSPAPAEPVTVNELRPLRKKDKVIVTITHIGYGGTCIGQLDSRLGSDEEPEASLPLDDLSLPVYCPKGACPGDVVLCNITRVRRRLTRPDGRPISPPPDGMEGQTSPRSYAEAVYLELRSPSPKSVAPVCAHSGHFKLGGGGCGGCTMLQVPYALQLSEKDQQLRTIYGVLERAGKKLPLQNVLPSQNTLEYRNKMEFTFGQRWLSEATKNGSSDPSTDLRNMQGKAVALGLHIPQRFDKVVDISECHIQIPLGNDILNEVRAASAEMLLEPYDPKSGTGYMRNVTIRSATNRQGRQELMVNLITSSCDVPDRLVPLAERLHQRFSDIVCVMQNVRGVRGDHLTEEERERLLIGDRPYIEQVMCGLTFRISANSFFQTNVKQAEILYEHVRKMACLKPTDVILDLFCGTGTIGLSLARHVNSVYGVDITESSIEDALVNAQNNDVYNAHFLKMNLEKLKSFNDGLLPEADVIVMDPPRAGLHPDLIKFLSKTQARIIIYVSCNPMTQVRDVLKLDSLVPGKFKVAGIQPVDMFPNSHHVETVLSLHRN